MNDVLWRPSTAQIQASRMDAFRRRVNLRYNLQLEDYAALHRWSIEQRAAFWQTLADFFQVLWHAPPTQVLAEGTQMPEARWFRGATLNFAEHLLRRRDDRPAVIAVGEDGRRRALSHAQLAADVAGLQNAFKAMGIEPGDRIGAIMPNTWETLVAMLACTSLGVVWSSCSPEFGVHGIIDRFGQIAPKVLIACAGYQYAGKVIDQVEKINQVCAQLPELAQLIVVPHTRAGTCAEDFSAGSVSLWDDVYQPGGQPDFVALPFDHPLYILYSSGTTGVPKCIVHRAGGVLLQHLKEHGLHNDLKADEVLFYYTTCGWMMWNWLASGLAVGATLVLYDGSPMHPGPERLLDLIDAEGIHAFGTSAKYLATLEQQGLQPMHSHRLERLRLLLSTGSPLSPHSYDYVYAKIKTDLCLASMSGGTDIVSCFVLGNPTLPVRRGEIACKGLGMAVEVWDENGQSVTGEKGELVCTRNFPSMPLGFWQDQDGSRYLQAYFSQFPGVWAQGDYAEQRASGGMVIHGRSDAVLNPGGVRIGTAEIYRQVEKIEQVLESIAIGQDWHGDVRVVLFVRLRDGLQLDEPLRQRIRQVIRQYTTPRHVPAVILQVNDMPRTLSGKLVELAVRNVVHGLAVKNTDALANPEALEQFRDRTELRDQA
ncbi:acetoacetate--CoA ligase [Pseudomonas plecoglossicida]|uniref:Acetoacetate--CoA ligase n=1 Tax=Pseudomonas plecoglossicida TaxID=70775 RepID=A0AAD0QUV8_PSEDL|nr:acetoacetate--CoA ligase [Pseudomonas plecoglossicida]AXM94757.1 acetoacetate--CoA ligase [Pseudomonas plecoglossicida]EPB96438.1 acetoacetyl-CoA synthetase [Pseudomonas plecoglossicida NB2011]QLB55498.1 acetoacetate--CoA ligase [Pseudomonas plecoglossicida]GLR38606.1 acetoacetyl-CoA synthetase [Pseudomonas plecoglossicida]